MQGFNGPDVAPILLDKLQSSAAAPIAAGEARDTVVVVGEGSAVSSAPGDWGGSIARAKLESLPLNGRDLFDLASQQPGATIATTAVKSMTTGSGIRISVNGAPLPLLSRVRNMHTQSGREVEFWKDAGRGGITAGGVVPSTLFG